jgi:DNA-binding GntR family transcriptional regulator
MMTTETKQVQESTMTELVDRLAAIDATADHNGGLKLDNLREHHNITDEIKRRKLRTQMEAMRQVTATIGDDSPRHRSADLAYGSRWNGYQQ